MRQNYHKRLAQRPRIYLNKKVPYNIFLNPNIARYFLAYVTYELLEVVKILFCVVKSLQISNNLVVLHHQCAMKHVLS